jgi:hypothetical protein
MEAPMYGAREQRRGDCASSTVQTAFYLESSAGEDGETPCGRHGELALVAETGGIGSLAASTSCKIGAMMNPSLEKVSVVQLFIPLPGSNTRNDL